MDTLIETIRFAVTDSATAQQKQAGAAACRTILTALEGQVGQPLAAPPSAPQVGVDQMLDLAIAKLRSMLPAEGAARAPRLAIPMVTPPGGAS
jgi:hypothetical protein